MDKNQKKIFNKMYYESVNNLNDYLDSSECFITTWLAEWYANENDIIDIPEVLFEIAFDVEQKLIKEGIVTNE